ncbi:MAG: SGNH/GDSL hydrolase family protein [Anaerolineae bacterium]|nr:SGNH/GDSL hydrolase family protein [Anaerolineae bacterium]
MRHVVLLGDSIFDNAAYVAGGSAVIDRLRVLLPADWQASLLAVDGSITSDVIGQLDRLPPDTTHIVISAGGNDALLQSSILSERADSVGGGACRLMSIGQQFEDVYRQMLNAVLRLRKHTAICTIYYPRFSEAIFQQAATGGLLVFNDCIVRAAIQFGLPLIDLRVVCAQPEDYANEIEPSSVGGDKIAAAISIAIREHDFSRGRVEIYI